MHLGLTEPSASSSAPARRYPWFSVEFDFFEWLFYTGSAYAAWAILAFATGLPYLGWVWLLVLLFYPLESLTFDVWGFEAAEPGYRWVSVHSDGLSWICFTALCFTAWAVVAHTFSLPYLPWTAYILLLAYPLERFAFRVWGPKYEGGPIP